MKREEILELLPYGAEFLWLDCVQAFDPAGSISAQMTYRRESPVLAAHFSSSLKVVPACLIVEQICQAALLLSRLDQRVSPSSTFMIGRVKAEFFLPAETTCTISCDVSLRRGAFETVAIHGEAKLEERVIARARVLAKSLRRT